jgi:PRD1 phage membrane DNA delivery
MNQITGSVVTILLAIVGVAILAVLVSKQSNTANVIQAGASGFSNSLATAISPISGSSLSPNLSYPTSF